MLFSRWHIPVGLDQGKHEEAALPAVYSHFFEESEYEHLNTLGMQHDCRSVISLHSLLPVSPLYRIWLRQNEVFVNVSWIKPVCAQSEVLPEQT